MNIVGENSYLEGTVYCEVDFHVAGRFKGIIITKGTLHVYVGAMVEGTIKAKDLTVAGRIEGEIEVSNRLRVMSSADLEGRIHTRILEWEEGASLVGEVSTVL